MAYVSPAVVRDKNVLADGRVQLIMGFVGNAGEPEVRETYMLEAGTVAADLRLWVHGILAKLNNRQTIGAAVTVGQTVPALAPTAPPAPTAKAVWLAKVARRQALAGPTYSGAAATALAALDTDINATYAAGFMDA